MSLLAIRFGSRTRTREAAKKVRERTSVLVCPREMKLDFGEKVFNHPSPNIADEICDDSGLGQVFGVLFAVVKKALETTQLFRSILQTLKSTLTSVEPVVRYFDSLEVLMDRPSLGHPIEVMRKGVTLVRECSGITKYQYIKRHHYTRKLQRLDDEIWRFIQLYIPLIASREAKYTLVQVKDLKKVLRRLSLAVKYEGSSFKRAGWFESCAAPVAPDFVVGLEVPFQRMKEWLRQGGFSVNVVTAPGGFGKTTLAKKLCHDADIEGKFKDNIFFVRLSRSPNLVEIVQRMIHFKGKDVPEIETEDDAVCHLQQLLGQIRQTPILLVLDDIWSESEDLLDKFACDLDLDYKILVTSRYELPSFGPSCRLDQLSHQDARKLFCQYAVTQDGISRVLDDDLIDKVVMCCKGWPLALTVVGKSLSGMHSSIWQSRLLEWSEGLSIIDSNSDILDCLRSSLDDLDGLNLHKECFMDLGAFPAGHVIPATVLIDMWVELHNFDAGGVQASLILHELAARSLADLLVTRKDESDGDGFYNDVFVMQHDFLRELAIHQNGLGPIEQRERLNLEIHGNKFPDWTKEQLVPLKARLVSISTDQMFSSIWPNMELPEVEVLVLNFRAKIYTLPHCMENMVKLKTLVVTNNVYSPAELSNFPLLGYLPNLKRIRLERIKDPFLSMSYGTLKNLEKATFFMCSISQDLISIEAMPNFVEIEISYCNDLERLPVGICGILTLRKMSITNCHNFSALPDQIGGLSNLEVLRLNSCTSLLELPESIGTLKDLSFLDISDCCSIKKLPDQIGELCKLKELDIKGCLDMSALPKTIIKLDRLEYVICDTERSILWRSIKHFLPKLKVKLIEEDINLNWLRVR